MKKRGFTLVELLAVIIILSIVGLIVIPTILNIIESVKKSAFESSIKGIEDALMYNMDLSETKNYKVENGKITNILTNEEVKIKGGNDLNGEIKVKKDGTIIYAINNGETCIIKRDGQDEIEQIKNIDFCTMDVATNLVVNGYGEYGDDTGILSANFKFQNGTFKQIVEYGALGNHIKIDSNKKYYYSIDLKSDIVAKVSIGLQQFDIDKKSLNYGHMLAYQQNITTLKEDLKNGDTVIYFDDITKLNIVDGDPSYKRGLAIWNYQNSNGLVGDLYTRNVFKDLFDYSGINKNDNTITLKTAWNNGNVLAGTKVSFPTNGGWMNYSLVVFSELSTDFQTYERYISETGMAGYNFLPGTQYVKPYGYAGTATNNIYYKNIVLREVE